MAEYGSLTVFSDGTAMIVNPDDQHNAHPQTFFTKQTGGPGVLSGGFHKIAVGPSSAHPNRFVLEQNYPNPFNPTTTIDYEVPSDGHVTLRVYDVLGKEVVTLVDQSMAVGRHLAVLDASQLAGGVYFYRLEAGSFMSVKKLLLLK